MLAHASERLGVSPMLTQHPRHAEQLAAGLPADASLLVVTGGDGTLSEVVNGLMQRPPDQRPPVLLIPGGSGNDVARMIGIRRSIPDVERRLAEPRVATWDVIRAELTSPLQEATTRYCINVMSAGITAEVSQLFNRSMRRLPPDIGYTLAALLCFARYRAGRVDLDADTVQISRDMLLVAMANSRWFGSGIGIAPDASPDDGKMNLTVAAGVSPLQFVGMLPRLRRARHVSHPGIFYDSTTECRIGAERPIPVEIDGEFSGFTPLRVTVIPRAIQLVT